jgi:hypothetical protein
MPHWFIITVHDLYCFASLTGTSLLGMIVLFDFILHCLILTGPGLYCFSILIGPSVLGLFALFHFMLHWFFLAGFVLFYFPHWLVILLHYFTSFFSGSSLLSMAYIVSLHVSLVFPF